MSHDIVPLQPAPASLSASEQMVSLLSHLLTLVGAEQEPAQPTSKRGRGRPATFPMAQLWLAVLVGMLTHAQSIARIWREMRSGPIGSFPLVKVTYEAVRSRLLKAGMVPLQHFFLQIRDALRLWQEQEGISALPLARFAPCVVALDESRLDALKRLTADLREVPDKSPQLRPGNVAGLARSAYPTMAAFAISSRCACRLQCGHPALVARIATWQPDPL